MRRSQALGILCAFTAVVVAAACGDDEVTGNGYNYDGGSTGDGSSGDATTDDGSTSDGSTTDGTAGDTGTDAAAVAKIVDINAPNSPTRAKDGDAVHVTGVVATSPIFVVSKSKTTCNYGVFVVDANATFLPYSGLLAFAGGPGTGDAGTCPGTSALPADVKVGDTLDITGKYSLFASTSCGKDPNPTPVPGKSPEIVVSASSKLGTATPPPPVVLTVDDLRGGFTLPGKDGGTDAATDAGDAGDASDDAAADGGTDAGGGGAVGDPLKYTGAIVELHDVTAKTKPDSFGAWSLDPSGLVVGSKIVINGANPSPAVTAGQTFTKLVGIGGYLDFCLWSIEPRTLCDFTPPQADAGTCP